MAKLGFYDIRTFECLSRTMDTDCFNYNSIYKSKESEENKKEDGGQQAAQKGKISKNQKFQNKRNSKFATK